MFRRGPAWSLSSSTTRRAQLGSKNALRTIDSTYVDPFFGIAREGGGDSTFLPSDQTVKRQASGFYGDQACNTAAPQNFLNICVSCILTSSTKPTMPHFSLEKNSFLRVRVFHCLSNSFSKDRLASGSSLATSLVPLIPPALLQFSAPEFFELAVLLPADPPCVNSTRS